MKLIANTPEEPIVEHWQWRTDVIVSTDGTEQRISLSEFPKRSLELDIGCDTEDEVAQVTRSLMLAGDGFAIPFYQAATRLTADAAQGEQVVTFNAARTDLREGCDALLFDALGRVERVTIAGLSAIGATLALPLGAAWGRRASIAPVWGMNANGNIAVSRRNPDHSADLKLSLTELEYMEPFANEFAPVAFTALNGYPVLQQNSIGTSFEQSYESGVQTIDYGGVIELRNPWLHSQIIMPRTFLCQRILQPQTWAMWRAFADYARGSANPFYLPTYRQDFPLVAIPAAGAVVVTFKGTEYVEDFAPFEPFRQFAFFFEDGGVHFASVSNCVNVGGNSRATFAPAIPNDKTVTRVSMLLKVRIADDKVSCEHRSLETIVSINLRTAD